MAKELELEEKLRRSEVLTQEDIYKDFMLYAREVSDELDIYAYMEENEIGTNVSQYWIQRFRAMRDNCQLVSLVKLIYKAQKYLDAQGDQICLYAHKLKHELFQVIGKHCGESQRRKPQILKMFHQQIYPQTRMIGNMEVYVDSPERQNYQLEDFASYIEKKMPEFCSIEREAYQRKQARKPPSFLAKKEQHLLKLAEQLLSKNNRKSYHDRNSRGTRRLSNRASFKYRENYDQSFYQTPSQAPKTPEHPHIDKQALRQKMESDRSKDSVEILKDIAERKSGTFNSPKFKFKYQGSSHQQVPLEKVRCQNHSQKPDEFFSFGKKKRRWSLNQEHERAREESLKEIRDDAFIEYSFSKDGRSIDGGTRTFAVKREDFELGLLIRQCQSEKYDKLDTQTFSSDIDSNQQNNVGYEDQLNLPTFGVRTRKPFEVLLEMSSNIKDKTQAQLEQLIEGDDDRNPQQFEEQDRKIVQHSEMKKRYLRDPVFYSQRKPCVSREKDSDHTFVRSSRN